MAIHHSERFSNVWWWRSTSENKSQSLGRFPASSKSTLCSKSETSCNTLTSLPRIFKRSMKSWQLRNTAIFIWVNSPFRSSDLQVSVWALIGAQATPASLILAAPSLLISLSLLGVPIPTWSVARGVTTSNKEPAALAAGESEDRGWDGYRNLTLQLGELLKKRQDESSTASVESEQLPFQLLVIVFHYSHDTSVASREGCKATSIWSFSDIWLIELTTHHVFFLKRNGGIWFFSPDAARPSCHKFKTGVIVLPWILLEAEWRYLAFSTRCSKTIVPQIQDGSYFLYSPWIL